MEIEQNRAAAGKKIKVTVKETEEYQINGIEVTDTEGSKIDVSMIERE